MTNNDPTFPLPSVQPPQGLRSILARFIPDSIAVRLNIITTVAVIVMLVFTTLFIITFTSFKSAFDNINLLSTEAQRADDLFRQILTLSRGLDGVINENRLDAIGALLAQTETMLADFATFSETAIEFGLSDDVAFAKENEPVFLGIRDTSFEVIALYRNGDLEAAKELKQRVDRDILHISEALAVSTEQRQFELAELINQTSILQQRLLLVIVLSLGMGTILLFGVNFGLTRSISLKLRQFRQLADAAARIAAGDYSARIRVVSKDEIAQLSNAFNQMIDAVEAREMELTQRAEELRIATAKAKEAARVKGEFLANVSHELRTPLNAIIGFSDMLLMGMSGELNSKQRHKMERLRENGVRLLTLINNILDITRIEARRVEIVLRPFSPRTLTDRLSSQMAVLAEQSRLEFRTTVDPDLPETLMGDEQRIEQVVVNLLSNALKFTDKGSVTLEIFANRAENTWCLAVADTGIGIPPHALNVIFEEFQQVDGSSSRAYKGSGLGLAITRNLVRLMDGHIFVESELGQGSKFSVIFPIITGETMKAEVLEKASA